MYLYIFFMVLYYTLSQSKSWQKLYKKAISRHRIYIALIRSIKA